MSQATLTDRPYRNSNLFSSHYLDERVQERDEWECDAEAQEALGDLQSLFELEGGLVEGYDEDPLIDNWIDEVLDVLGFGTQVEVTLPDGGGFVDELLFESDTSRRDAARVYLDTGDTTDLFERGVGLVEAKQWNADFIQRFSEQRPYRNASHQIKHYLENTPENIQWGVLTNGRRWRLYGTKDYETQTYYEIDLPELLQRGNLEAFKYFYVFFRPTAFRESAGTTFLDEVWSESETAAQELGEDLQDNVFTALRVLGRGFVETNDDLTIDPDDEEALDELKDQSLVLLYRLMFVLYAEARGLIHPEGQTAEDEYKENFSLDKLRLEIHDDIGGVDEGFDEEFSEHSTAMWSRLQDLFRLIDMGESDLGIPPYNGGLFDREKHEFLSEHGVSDRHLAEVIYRLSTTENGDGRYVLADYADLDTRHLGSVYEGLLEHQFQIAPEEYAAVADDGGQVWKPKTEVSMADAVETVPEGGLYVVNDKGERKVTGAYYTPDYVVTYIVEETVGPLVEEIREDLTEQGFDRGTQEYLGPFLQRVTDLKILDPAMGSGHFLTRATGYLAEEVMNEVRGVEDEVGAYWDEQHVRREIAKECIYGVDVNGMAVELAKLSMWLETLAADRPLAFLNHHLKTGNSLVGSDITEVLSDDTGDEDGQLTIYQALARVRQETLGHVMELMQNLLEIDNETLEDIKSMEEIYAEIRADRLYQRLFELANVHTTEQFGFDIPEGSYEEMAQAIEDEEDWSEIREKDWFQSASATAEEETFFHWELEYPEVFFGEGGNRLDDAGFDAVIGNPPYVKIQNIPESDKAYYDNQYEVSEERYDLYGLFLEKAERISASYIGFITPNKFFESSAGESLRRHLSDSGKIDKIIDFNQCQVFGQASIYTCLLFVRQEDSSQYIQYKSINEEPEHQLRPADWLSTELPSSGDRWSLVGETERRILSKLEQQGIEFEDVAKHIFVGIQTSANDVFVLEKCDTEDEVVHGYSTALDQEVTVERGITRPYVEGQNLSRFGALEGNLRLIYPYTDDADILAENVLKTEYPQTYAYLEKNKAKLDTRGGEGDEFDAWYAHWRQRHPDTFERSKIIVAQIVNQGQATYDSSGEYYFSNMLYSPGISEEHRDEELPILGILNSTLVWYYITQTGSVLRGGYYRYTSDYLSPISLAIQGETGDLKESVEAIIDYHSELDTLNQNLLDHLGDYADGVTLGDIGLAQPTENLADSILSQTTSTRPNLRIGEAEVLRENPTSVEIRLTARYKPDDEDENVTDQWGYTETELLPALHISDLTETQADLVKYFVPIAVDKANGFANFRETATKTNSLVDRLRGLTLPAVEDAQDGLESYIETKERAEGLEEQIQRTDELIDEIVYELYGLTDDEVEIVEEAVG